MISQITALSLFAISVIYFYIKGADINLLLILLIAATTYSFMIKDPKHIERYRYTDWSLTSPLMLYGLLKANNTPLTIVLSLILLNLLMITAAVIGATSNANFWFSIWCVLLIPVLYYLYHLKTNNAATQLTVLLWSLYPIVWVLEKDNILSFSESNITFSIMDVISKIGLVDLLL